MDRVQTYLREFKAMLCLTVAESHSSIVSTAYYLPRTKDTGDRNAYQINSDERIKEHTLRYRNLIYMKITSYEFVQQYPIIKEIDKSEHSSYDKLIILMSVVGFDTNAISKLLLARASSISTLRTRHNEEIDYYKSLLADVPQN